MRYRPGLVRVVALAEAADPADVSQALRKGRESAVPAAAGIAAGILRAPRIILRRGRDDDASGCEKKSG